MSIKLWEKTMSMKLGETTMSLRRLGLALMLPAALVLAVAEKGVAQEATGVVASAVELLPQSVKDSGILRIGGSYQSAPMTYLVNDGQDKAGISYELATEAAKRLGLTPEFSVIPFPGQVAALAADKIDLVWETTSINEERLLAATFIPFATIGYGVLVAKGNPAGVTDFESLCGLRIGVPQGSIFPQYIEDATEQCKAKGLPEVEMLTYRGSDEARLAIRSGNSDGYMSGHSNNVFYAMALGEESSFDAVQLTEIGTTPIGIQFKKGNVQLAEAVAEALNAMIADGSYAAIFDKFSIPTMKVDSVSVME